MLRCFEVLQIATNGTEREHPVKKGWKSAAHRNPTYLGKEKKHLHIQLAVHGTQFQKKTGRFGKIS